MRPSPATPSLPCVAIVGRPNVGKSSLFNALLGRRVAIVEPTRGVTRDRLTATVTHGDVAFELVDTGGVGVVDVDGLSKQVERQIDAAIERADVFLFVVDVRDGVVPDDQVVANRLRSIGKPILLAANKADELQERRGANPRPGRHRAAARQRTVAGKTATAVAEFFELGLGEPRPVSALHRRGCGELLAALVAALPPGAGEAAEPRAVAMKLAIVGRRNVGKSTLVNAIAGEERMIVSEVPGTTRDAVDVQFEKDGQHFVVIDTAGVRKARNIGSSIEFYSLVRARRAIERADVVMLLLDVTEPIVDLDVRLAHEIAEHLKPCVIVANKWDLAKGKMVTEQYAAYLAKKMPGLDYAPLTFMTAKTARRVMPTIELAQQLFKQAHARASTPDLNRSLAEAVAERSPRPHLNRVPRFYYGTQVGVAPPTLLVFVNDHRLVDGPYRRYLANALRKRLPFPEVPVSLQIRSRRRSGPEA